MSYPIAEVAAEGDFIVTILPATGGLVNRATVAEQILYEIGDPANYLLPDVACDFSDVRLDEVGENRLRVSNAKGRAPGDSYKVCATWVDGYRLMGSAFIGGKKRAVALTLGYNAAVVFLKSALGKTFAMSASKSLEPRTPMAVTRAIRLAGR